MCYIAWFFKRAIWTAIFFSKKYFSINNSSSKTPEINPSIWRIAQWLKNIVEKVLTVPNCFFLIWLVVEITLFLFFQKQYLTITNINCFSPSRPFLRYLRSFWCHCRILSSLPRESVLENVLPYSQKRKHTIHPPSTSLSISMICCIVLSEIDGFRVFILPFSPFCLLQSSEFFFWKTSLSSPAQFFVAVVFYCASECFCRSWL